MPTIAADEKANEWARHLERRIEEAFKDWDEFGVPRPFGASDAENVVVSWRHPRYRELVGSEALSHEFCQVYRIVAGADTKSFLIVAAIVLKAMGCTVIYFTDSPGDEGVDCIGQVHEGRFKSICMMVQAKTSGSPVGRGILFGEYFKYLALPHTEQYLRYRRALDVDKKIDGISWIYVFMTNNEFDFPARQAAARLGILLRSRLQIAHILAGHMTLSQLKTTLDELEGSVRPDLTRNIALRIIGS